MDFDLCAGLAVLERTPATLRALLSGLSDDWLDGTEGPDTWSPRDVVGHLIHAERSTWGPRARIVMAQEGDRAFPAFDRAGHMARPRGLPIVGLLDEFAEARAASLAMLRDWSLADEELALTGEHPAFGTVTLRQLLSAWVAHDLGHVRQIVRVMARQYRDAVGPWREYLSIMDDR